MGYLSAAQKVVKGAKATGHFAKDQAKLIRRVDPSFHNLGTGLQATGFAGVAAFGVFGAGSAISQRHDAAIASTTGKAEYIGNMPDYAYDAQGQADRKTGDKSLGATGDLVFGLNASRHGR